MIARGAGCVALALALALGLGATPAHAQTFFQAPAPGRTGMAVEVQRGTVAGVMVSQAAGQVATIATFSGAIVHERNAGATPLSTRLVDSAAVGLTSLASDISEDASFRRTRFVGGDELVFERAGQTLRMAAYGYDAARTLQDWAGRHALVREHADGSVDAVMIDLGVEVQLEVGPALAGTAPDGRAGLLLFDPASGVVAGAYEVEVGTPVAFALLGSTLTTEHAQGLWVDTGADGVLLGPDGTLHMLRTGPAAAAQATSPGKSIRVSAGLVRAAQAALLESAANRGSNAGVH